MIQKRIVSNLDDENDNFGEKEDSTLARPKIANEETPSLRKKVTLSKMRSLERLKMETLLKLQKRRRLQLLLDFLHRFLRRKVKLKASPKYLDQDWAGQALCSMAPDSLTDEEKEALANDLKINAASQPKRSGSKQKKVNKVAQAFFGFITAGGV